VLVHCRSGKDRTGLFLSYYLCVTEGLRPSEAIAELRRVRPIALTAEGWETFSYEVLGALGFVG
jgi:protein-tyrosine phosphatase